MKQQQVKRSKWFNIRMTEDEYSQVEKLFRETTCSTMSEYGRRLLLGKPAVMRYRNQSLDDFLADMLQLRKELNQIGNNFNQAVLRLHAFKNAAEIQQWILLNEQDKTQFFRQVESISNKINQVYQLWSHE